MAKGAGIGEEFMAKTRYEHLGASDQGKGVAPPPVAWTYEEQLPRVELPPPAELESPTVDLAGLMTRRRSLRRYTATPLTLPELSLLLWCTQGVKEAGKVNTLRTVPSAGARHPLETYLLINRVEGVEPGLYAYEALSHRLVQLRARADIAQRLVTACYDQAFVGHSAVTFFWVAVPYRTCWRYGERGYRYMHLDAGHAGQNLYLTAESIGAGACAIAAFHDDQLIEALELDGESAFVIYVATVGKRPAAPA